MKIKNTNNIGRFNVCSKEVSRLSVNELIPFEQTLPFQRIAHILDNTCHDFIEKEINLLAEHCKNKKPQHKCSACVVLGDLKLKLFLTP